MSNDNKIESSSLKKKKKQKNNNNYKNNAEKVKDDVDEEPPLLLKDLASDGFASSSSTQNALPPPPDEENQNQQQQGGEKVFGTGAATERPTLTQAPLIEVEAYLVEDEEIEESGADGGDGLAVAGGGLWGGGPGHLAAALRDDGAGRCAGGLGRRAAA